MNVDFTQDIFSGKQLLILGAGYVGAATADAFQHLGGRVSALTRNPIKAAELRLRGMETITSELTSSDWHDQLSKHPEFILNCVSSGGGGTEGYRRSYLEGASSIVQWGRGTHQTGHLVYTGSTSVYPQGEGKVVDESMPTDAAEDRTRILMETEETLRQWSGPWTVL